MMGQSWIVVLGAYLLGSIPTAAIVSRIVAGVDIRQLGDGNMGAKNTFESLSKPAGVAVAIVDIGKGMLAVSAARVFSGAESATLLAGACAVLGHDFPVFLKFRGGQGMATTLGVFIILFPVQIMIGFIVWSILFASTRNWNLSCSIGFGLAVVAMWVMGQTFGRVLYAIGLLLSVGARKLMQIRRGYPPPVSAETLRFPGRR